MAIPIVWLLYGPTIQELAEYLAEQLDAAPAGAGPAPKVAPPPSGDVREHVDNMSDEEVDELLRTLTVSADE